MQAQPPLARHVPPRAALIAAFAAAEQRIEARWGIPVRISDVPAPFTGDLNGAEIAIDYDNDAESALFILIHLFGHTVQWNCDARAREIGMRPLAGPWTEADLQEIADYEVTACRYSLALLHEAKVTTLDQWVSDFAACDAAYLMHYYRTGTQAPFFSFWRAAPPLQPLAIPEFAPTAWRARWNGVVL